MTFLRCLSLIALLLFALPAAAQTPTLDFDPDDFPLITGENAERLQIVAEFPAADVLNVIWSDDGDSLWLETQAGRWQLQFDGSPAQWESGGSSVSGKMPLEEMPEVFSDLEVVDFVFETYSDELQALAPVIETELGLSTPFVLLLGADGSELMRINAPHPSITPRGTIHLNFLRDFTFSPDGDLLATVSGFGWIRLWQYEEPERWTPVAQTFTTSETSVVTFSQSGELILVATARWMAIHSVTPPDENETDMRVRIDEILSTPTFEGSITPTSAHFNPAATLIAMATREGTIQLWGVME